MRDVVLAMFMSLDGHIAGPGGQFFGPKYSADVQKHWIDRNMERAGTMMYGRVAYQSMVDYWTSPAGAGPQADALAEMDKLVFSRTLTDANWGKVTIVRDDIAGEIGRRKAETGKDMVLIAGAGIAQTFLAEDLVDEICLLLVPMTTGGGTRLFADGAAPKHFRLVEALPFDTGAVRLTYRR